MVAELGLNPGLPGPQRWLEIISAEAERGAGELWAALGCPLMGFGVTQGLLKHPVSAVPKATVGGKLLRSFPPDSCPLVNQSSTALGMATRDLRWNQGY